MPLIDIGTLGAIRAGRIKVRGDIASFRSTTVTFTRSSWSPSTLSFWRPAIGRTSARCFRTPRRAERNRHAARQRPSDSGTRPVLLRRHPFPAGQLRQIGIEATRIAAAAA